MGSSFFPKIITVELFGITGPTGPTGPTGNIGPTGYGPTGATGVGISYIGLSQNQLVTYYQNGSSISSGATLVTKVNVIRPIKTNFAGSGANIISSQPSQNEIEFRSIRGSTSTSGRSEVVLSENGNTLTIEYISENDGFTLVNLSTGFNKSFVGTTGSGLSLTNIRDSFYDTTFGDSKFTSKDITEKARGLGFSGATAGIGITCNYVYNGGFLDGTNNYKIVKIDPSCKSLNQYDYNKTNKTYVIDMEGSHTRVQIGSPVSALHSTAFTLVIKNALNSTSPAPPKKFISSKKIYWPFGVEPCFSGSGGTDVYHFYSLFDSWFGSVAYSSAFAGQKFNCSSQPPQIDPVPLQVQTGACCEQDTCPPLKNVIHLASDKNISGAVESDGKIKLWGKFSDGTPAENLLIPQGFSAEKITLSADNKTLFATSYSTKGPTCFYIGSPLPYHNIPAGLTNNVVDIRLSDDDGIALALKSNNTIVQWGNSTVTPSITNVVNITAGRNHRCARFNTPVSGGLTCWGDNTYGQLNIPSGITFNAISAYDYGNISISSGFTVYGWGRGPIPSEIPAGLTAIQVSGCFPDYTQGDIRFAVIRKQNGTIMTVGTTSAVFSTVPSGYSFATDILAGGYHAFAVVDSKLVGWGSNLYGQLNFPCGNCGVGCFQKLRKDCKGANQIFYGEGSTCSPNICGVTGPCCEIIGQQAEIFVPICRDNITFENCLCGSYSNAVRDSTKIFHDEVKTCQEIENCEATTTIKEGACCVDGKCIDGLTEEECAENKGIYRFSSVCSGLPHDYCVLGRCGIIPLDSPGTNYSCNLTIQSECTKTNSFYYSDWLLEGTCENSPIIFSGACCTGPSGNLKCETKYEFAQNYEQVFNSLTSTGKLEICTRGLCGSYKGNNVGCANIDCEDNIVDLSTGACFQKICLKGTEIISKDNMTKTQCESASQFLFLENFNLNSLIKCCAKQIDSGGNIIYSNSDECIFTTLQDCVTKNWLCPSNGINYIVGIVGVKEEGGEKTSLVCSDYPCPADFGDSFAKPPKENEEKSNTNTQYIGEYYPNGTVVNGKNFKTCCPPKFEDIMDGKEKESEKYTTKIDWYGYGVTFANNDSKIAENIKFKIHLYGKDLTYTGKREIVKEVIWGQTDSKCAWGPHIELSDDGNYFLNDLYAHDEEYAYYKDEGYWQVKGISYSAEYVIDKTFNKQPSTAFTDALGALIDNSDSIFSNNGAWRRNWGLYNTMRLFGADNAYLGLNNRIEGVDYEVSDEWTAARLVDKLNRDYPTPSDSSSWFIPSLDEMAFICEKLPEINESLGEDMIGDYWTSTGAFDEKTNEGIKTKLNQPSLTGSKAWAFRIEKNTGEYKIYTRKENRSSKLKVRPIRIQLDNIKDVPAKGSEEYKLWKLQPLKWVTNKIVNPK